MVAALCNDQTSDPTSSLIPTLWIRGGFCGPRNTVTHSRECLPKPCRTERKLVEIFHLSCRSLGGSWGGGALASLDLWYHASGDTNPLPESRLHTPLGLPRGASGARADVQAQTLRLLDEGVSCGLLLAPSLKPYSTTSASATEPCRSAAKWEWLREDNLRSSWLCQKASCRGGGDSVLPTREYTTGRLRGPHGAMAYARAGHDLRIGKQSGGGRPKEAACSRRGPHAITFLPSPSGMWS